MIDTLAIAPEVSAIVAPGSLSVLGVMVIARDARMDDPLADAAARMRSAPDATDVTSAVRTMYRRVGIDPTKTRPSSEALLRRVRKGDQLPRINSLVDVINWCSLESRLPFGLYDLASIRGRVTLRLGREGEEYLGIRKDAVHVDGRLVLADEAGPFGNPTSDSARTMVTTSTTHALVVVFTPASLSRDVTALAIAATEVRINRYCVGQSSDRP